MKEYKYYLSDFLTIIVSFLILLSACYFVFIMDSYSGNDEMARYFFLKKVTFFGIIPWGAVGSMLVWGHPHKFFNMDYFRRYEKDPDFKKIHERANFIYKTITIVLLIVQAASLSYGIFFLVTQN